MGEVFKSRIRSTLELPSGYAKCVKGPKGLDFVDDVCGNHL